MAASVALPLLRNAVNEEQQQQQQQQQPLKESASSGLISSLSLQVTAQTHLAALASTKHQATALHTLCV
jgi:hypothetical protein